MKQQQAIIAIFALIIFAASANAQFGGLLDKAKEKVGKVKQEVEKVKKTKQELEQLAGVGGNKNTTNQPSKNQTNVNAASWITFSKSHTHSNEARNSSLNTLGCGDGVFATVNYREPVDNSGGYTVSMLVDGAVVAKQQMSGGSETSVNQTIHIELIADDDADDNNYPKVTFAKAKTILGKLPPANHTVQIVVSLIDNPKNIAVGEFEYTGGAGCDAKDQRKPKEQKKTTNTQDNSNLNYVDFFNNCSDARNFTYEYPDGTSSTMWTEAGFPRNVYFPVGTKFWHGNIRQGEPFFILGKSQYTNEMDKARSAVKINLCQ